MDDLTRPLGRTIAERPRRSTKLLFPLIAGALCLPLATFAGWAMLAGDRQGGEPMALAPVKPGIETSAAPAQPPAIKVISRSNSLSETQQTWVPDGRSTVTIIDGSNGRRQDVVVPNFNDGPGAELPRKRNSTRRLNP